VSTGIEWCEQATDRHLTVHLAECENLVKDHEHDDLDYALTEAKNAVRVLREMVRRLGGDPDNFTGRELPEGMVTT